MTCSRDISSSKKGKQKKRTSSLVRKNGRRKNPPCSVHKDTSQERRECSVKMTLSTKKKFSKLARRISPEKHANSVQLTLVSPRRQSPGWMIQVTQSHPWCLHTIHKATSTCSYSAGYLHFTKIGLILSVRAIEFESMCGLDILILRPRDQKRSVWITACFDNQPFYRPKGYNGTSKDEHGNTKKLSTSSRAHTLFLFALEEPPCLTLLESPRL